MQVKKKKRFNVVTMSKILPAIQLNKYLFLMGIYYCDLSSDIEHRSNSWVQYTNSLLMSQLENSPPFMVEQEALEKNYQLLSLHSKLLFTRVNSTSNSHNPKDNIILDTLSKNKDKVVLTKIPLFTTLLYHVCLRINSQPPSCHSHIHNTKLIRTKPECLNLNGILQFINLQVDRHKADLSRI